MGYDKLKKKTTQHVFDSDRDNFLSDSKDFLAAEISNS